MGIQFGIYIRIQYIAANNFINFIAKIIQVIFGFGAPNGVNFGNNIIL